jgi:hypothetical protein
MNVSHFFCNPFELLNYSCSLPFQTSSIIFSETCMVFYHLMNLFLLLQNYFFPSENPIIWREVFSLLQLWVLSVSCFATLCKSIRVCFHMALSPSLRNSLLASVIYSFTYGLSKRKSKCVFRSI